MLRFDNAGLAGRPRTGHLDPKLPVMVGSRTGAPTLGSGGRSIPDRMALNPAAMITFPAPAASNVACDFLALRSPVRFVPRLMGPIRPRRLSADHDAIGSRSRSPEFLATT